MLNNILIVDDDEVLRSTLKGAFEKRKLKSTVAENAEMAMQLFRDNDFDVVILDYRLGARDGVSLLREMHVYNPMPVYIMLTGYANVPLAVETMKEGADSFMAKPCDVDALIHEAQKLMEKKKRRLPGMDEAAFRSYNLNILERIGIEKALKATSGNVSKASTLLGIDRRTLQRKMRRLFFWFLFCTAALSLNGSKVAHAEEASTRYKAAQLVNLTGDEDFENDQSAWDRTYGRKDFVFGKAPADFLSKHIDMLPKGRALDIATGEGRNAVFLAKKGFLVEGVDISAVGLRKAQMLAAENKVKIITVNSDLNKYQIRPANYSVILNFYYLQRNLFPQIKAGLKHGGVVVFETHTTEQLKNKGGGNWERDFLLRPGELKEAFAGFVILHYSETNDGKNAIASLIAKKP